MEDLTPIIELVSNIGAPAVAVILSMKYAINGMREDVKEIKVDVKTVLSTQGEHDTRLAVLEDRDRRQESVDAA